MNERMDGALTKRAFGILTEGKGEGSVTKYTAKSIRRADITTKRVNVYLL